MGKWTLRFCLIFIFAVACGYAGHVTVDLQPQWDESLPLANPDKGWYHHYFDNSIDKYQLSNDSDLTAFPGMDHIYLRLAWSYLEPEEGRFNWRLIDEQISKWTKLGMGISFRITCKETGTNRVEQQFATPRWVRDVGAKGGYYSKGNALGPEAPWEPVFDDPVFLDKLDAFLSAFAARYDGQVWLRYVDIGSLGDWGEGHTSSGSRLKYGYDTMEKHIDLHLQHFKRTLLVISDDYVTSLASVEDRKRLREKIIASGISYRDDSILVDWYVKTFSRTASVRSPELFAETWLVRPTVLELEHYGMVKQHGNWIARSGSSLEKFGSGKSGADIFRNALELMHATYIGYHGYAREWLADNPALTAELLNRCGYWFFPQTVTISEPLVAGLTNAVSITWLNRGVACAYRPYTLILKLEGAESFLCDQPSNNTRWLPGSAEMPWQEVYSMAIPASFPPGDLLFKFKMRSSAAVRDIKLPLKNAMQDKDGFYTIGRVRVAR